MKCDNYCDHYDALKADNERLRGLLLRVVAAWISDADPRECQALQSEVADALGAAVQPAAVQEIFGGDGSRELWRLINAVDHEKPEWEALYAIGCACQRLEALVRRLADNSPAATPPATEAQPPAALGDELIAWECRNCGELHRQNEDGCSCGWSRERGRATFNSPAATPPATACQPSESLASQQTYLPSDAAEVLYKNMGSLMDRTATPPATAGRPPAARAPHECRHGLPLDLFCGQCDAETQPPAVQCDHDFVSVVQCGFSMPVYICEKCGVSSKNGVAAAKSPAGQPKECRCIELGYTCDAHPRPSDKSGAAP